MLKITTSNINAFFNKKFLQTAISLKELILVCVIFIILLAWYVGKLFVIDNLSGDWLRFWVPNYYFVLSHLKEGLLPLWQPYTYMGVPGAFHPGYMLFYPFLWPVLLINLFLNNSLSLNFLGKTLELYLYLHLLLGALCTYLLLRDLLRLSKVPSFVAAIIFIFSIYSTANFDPTLIGKMYLPLLIYLLLNFLQKPRLFTFFLWIITNCILFTFGYIYYQIYFVYAQLFLGILFGMRAIFKTLYGLVVASGISSVILLPQLYYYIQAARVKEAEAAIFHISSAPFPTYLLNILIPNGIYVGSILTWGTIPLLFLIVGLANLKKDRFSFWLIGTFLFPLILGLGGYIGVQDILGGPPFFLDKLRSHGQIFILTFFTGTIIIAYGIEAALKGLKHERIENILWHFCGLLIVVLLLIPFQQANYLQDSREPLIAYGRFLILFVSGLVLYHFITKFRSKALVIFMVFITFMEFHYYYTNTEANKLGSTYNDYFARNSLIPEIPTKDTLFRYEFWGNQFAYNSSQLRVFSFSGYDGIPYAAAYNVSRFSVPKNYQFANVKYIVTTTEQNIPEYRLVNKVDPRFKLNETYFSTADGYGLFTKQSKNIHYVYEVKNYLPRFFVPNEVKTCPAPDCYKAENPPRIVYTKEQNIDIKNPQQKDVTIKVVKYDPNTITLDITTPKQTFIASSEIWDKGWSATIHNNPTTVINVSNGFRGFIVPQGKSTLTMTYSPPYFKEGLVGTLVGMLLLSLLFFKKQILYTRK